MHYLLALAVTLLFAAAPAWAGPPFPSAPLCSTHDDTAFHTLWNSADNCHYDHEHGEPYPAWAQSLWGDYTLVTGQEISYPWQTANENALKHNGYKLFHKDLRLGYPYSYDYEHANGDPCPAFASAQDITPGGPAYHVRVVAYSMQTHNLSHAHEAMTRKHSYFAQLLVCDPATDTFGTIITGGHGDYGQRVSPYQGPLLALPDQPQPPYDVRREPYLSHPCADAACGNFAFRQNKKFSNGSNWTNEPVHVVGANKIVNFSFRIRNVYDGIEDRQTQPSPVYLCTQDGGDTFHQPGCYSVGTQHNFFQVRGWGAPASLDAQDGSTDNFVTYSGFTDLNGTIDTNCTAAGPACVPLELTNVRVGSLMGDDQEKLFGFTNSLNKALFLERNICFTASGAVGDCEQHTPSGWIGPQN